MTLPCNIVAETLHQYNFEFRPACALRDLVANMVDVINFSQEEICFRLVHALQVISRIFLAVVLSYIIGTPPFLNFSANSNS